MPDKSTAPIPTTHERFGGNEGGGAPNSTAPDVLNVLKFIEQLADTLGVEVLFTGEMRIRGQRDRATTPGHIGEVLRADHMNPVILQERAVIVNRRLGLGYKGAELTAGVGEFLRQRKKLRKAIILERLLRPGRPLTAFETERAKAEWQHIGTLFHIDADLAIACLKHFIWQVFRKQLNRQIEHHLMPVIIGDQGSGKSRFVEMFLNPLRELASAPVRTSDAIDKRVVGMLSYAVLWLDDMEPVLNGAVDNLKNLMTSDQQLRRVLRTSMDVTAKQNTTLIGTSNHAVAHLVPDKTGHRRFVELPFRNGNVEKGGEETIWPTINSIDYELLFCSIDPFAISPLIPHLRALAAHQAKTPVESPLLRWLRQLDRNDQDILAITTAWGVRAGALHALYRARTGHEIRSNEFANEMWDLILQRKGPFCNRQRDNNKSYYYVFRAPVEEDVPNNE
ncbi:MAG: hypothetical protein EKK40_09615 [Bradyrhizobiaceae bacterium]|nr:MAG: hypothetical protein EKK40_09615 [Bradyrhizobiaceae bacterium]